MPQNPTAPARRKRVDARRNTDSLLEAAKTAFATSGVDAPAKEIAALAGVGVGTLYRHFPRRSDLVVAVLRREIDACADAGPALSAAHEPARSARAMAPAIHGVRRDQARARNGAALRRPGLRRPSRLLLGTAGTGAGRAARRRRRSRRHPRGRHRRGPPDRRRAPLSSGTRHRCRVQPADGGSAPRRLVERCRARSPVRLRPSTCLHADASALRRSARSSRLLWPHTVLGACARPRALLDRVRGRGYVRPTPCLRRNVRSSSRPSQRARRRLASAAGTQRLAGARTPRS